MEILKLLTNKALNNLHITLPVGAIIGLVVFVVYATTYAVSYDNRLEVVEGWEPYIVETKNIERNTEDIVDLKVAVASIDRKFDTKFDTFQSEFKDLLSGLLKE